MAKGITETDVHTAADEIITAGERPTVERIRAHLGTGSPNTVTRWLDTWWKQLGERLQKQQAHRALPQAPDALAFLAGEWWSLAMEHARANAEDAISQRRAALQAEQAALNTAKEAFRDEEALLRHQAADAAQLRELAQAEQWSWSALFINCRGRMRNLLVSARLHMLA
ncbi:DNA-binding protein [Thermomonas sp. S9]|uniref:DNA-binding protein n=1 Tax=Thermomonas sp. S9 TaxID=2885203 RepID=UPI00216B37C7|nr:DNA-binding protein [Thermomonas sp. S9]MCR6496275.1 DNA-binding protein [Thermomonas sp. S9]